MAITGARDLDAGRVLRKNLGIRELSPFRLASPKTVLLALMLAASGALYGCTDQERAKFVDALIAVSCEAGCPGYNEPVQTRIATLTKKCQELHPNLPNITVSQTGNAPCGCIGRDCFGDNDCAGHITVSVSKNNTATTATAGKLPRLWALTFQSNSDEIIKTSCSNVSPGSVKSGVPVEALIPSIRCLVNWKDKAGTTYYEHFVSKDFEQSAEGEAVAGCLGWLECVNPGN